MYLFILSPPRHGSTALYKLLWTSPNVSTFFGVSSWAGEGQFVPGVGKHFPKDRWDANVPVNWDGIKKVWHKAWDTSKPILCEKTPANICRAEALQNYFKQFAPVYFICLMRSPYARSGTDRWIKCAEYQRYNMQNLDNVFRLKYEELVGNLPRTIKRLIRFLPKLERLNKDVSRVPGIDEKRRNLPIQDMSPEPSVEQMRHQNLELKLHKDLLEFHGYEFKDV